MAADADPGTAHTTGGTPGGGVVVAPGALERLRRALSRVTSSGKYLPAVDGLRFVSILGVLLFHVGMYPEVLRNPDAGPVERFVAETVGMGRFGVQLFFAISGMILAMPFAEAAADGRPAPGLASYLLRRVSRIEPPYVICMLTFFALATLRHGGLEDGELRRLGASLVYVHQLVYRENSAYNPVTWSLELEVYFYLLAPFLFALLFRSGPVLRAALVAGLACLCAAFADTGRPLDFEHQGSLVAQGNYFLAGILVADLETRRRGAAVPAGTRALWDVAIVGAVVALWWLLRWDSPFASKGEYGRLGLLLRPALVAVLCLGVLRGRVFHAVLTLPWVAVIGGMCYTLYLWHYPFMRVLQGRIVGLRTGDFLTDYAVQSSILVAATIAVGAVLFVLFEKPFMHRDWFAKLVRRFRRSG